MGRERRASRARGPWRLAPSAGACRLVVTAVTALAVVAGCAAKGTSSPLGDEGDAAHPQPSLDAAPSAIDDAGTPTGEVAPIGDAGTSPEAALAAEAGDSTSCTSLPLCDGFESDTPGAAPNPSLWTVLMGCNPNNPNAAVDGGLTVGIDGTVAHNGKNSLRVVGGDSCGYYAVATSPFASLGAAGAQVYARFYARFTGAPTPNHNGFLSMYSGSSTSFLSMYSNQEQLRLGFQGNVVVWNYLSSDATLPDIDSMGEAQSSVTRPGNWDCLEFHLDSTNGDVEFWLNGASVAGLSYDGTSVQGVSDNWHNGGPTSLSLKSFGLGWLGLNDQYTAWFDDVALGGTRIGCD